MTEHRQRECVFAIPMRVELPEGGERTVGEEAADGYYSILSKNTEELLEAYGLGKDLRCGQIGSFGCTYFSYFPTLKYRNIKP